MLHYYHEMKLIQALKFWWKFARHIYFLNHATVNKSNYLL